MSRRLSKTDEEFGKAMCDRLGLRHEDTLQDWEVEAVNGKTVAVKMHVFKILSLDEYNELLSVAVRRAEA